MIERSFVGRVPELATLEATFDSVDGPWVLLIDGPAGIGKSRLVAEFARGAASRGVRVVSVLGTEFERATPLQLVHEMVDQVPEIEPAVLSEVLAGADIQELVRSLRQQLAAVPTVLIVDDAQWADAASLRVLAALMRTRPTATFRLVFAYREGQFPTALAAGLRALGAASRHVRVPPLTAVDTAALLPEFKRHSRDRLLTASHGNPLYLLLLAEMPETEWEADDYAGDSSALDRTLRAELAQLPARERLVAQAAAVCGPAADTELLCATAELARTELATAVDELAKRGWVSVTGGRVIFRHPLVRAAAYRLAGHYWRAEAHGRAATTLRAIGAPLLTRARHLEHTLRGGDDQAAADLMRAAEQALATTPADSARWIAAALDSASSWDDDDRARAELARGRALLLTGAAESAGAVLEPLARRSGEWQAEALLLYARCERMLGRVDSARALLATAAGLPGVVGNGPVQLELAILELQDDRVVESAARVDALCGSGGTQDPAVRASALIHRALGQVTDLRMDLAMANYRAAEHDFAQLTDTQLIDVVHGVSALGWAAYFLDEQRAGLAHLDRAIRVSRRFGRSFALPELHLARAFSLTKLGRLDEALAAAEDAEESAHLFRYPDVVAMAGTIKLRTLQFISPREELITCWRTVDALPRPVVRWWRGVVEAALHEIGGLLGLIADTTATAAQDRPNPVQATQLASQTRVALGYGRLDDALALLRHAEIAAQQTGLPSQTAAAALARAAYARAVGDLAAAETAAQQAISEFERAAMPVLRARAVLLAADIAGLRGDFTLATTRIATARQAFTATGAHELLAETITVQRRMAGGRPLTGASTLTAREREIADLAAHGHTNKDIATRLCLSPRTVEDHLSRILRKLGLTGRAGIARRLTELDESQV